LNIAISTEGSGSDEKPDAPAAYYEAAHFRACHEKSSNLREWQSWGG
jgi:hypothetical protein